MNKKVCLLILLILASSLCGCRRVVHGHQIKPIKTETEDFDTETAIKMISPGEIIIADMVTKDTATREEYEQFCNDIKKTYEQDTDDMNWQSMFFHRDEIEDKNIKILNLEKKLFYPTIYHQGIEVVSAYTEKIFYEDASLNLTLLHIIEKYTGNDPKMADWHREYYFIKRNGEWLLDHGLGGNYMAEGINNHYLPLKY